MLDEPASADLTLRALLVGGDRLSQRPAAHHRFALVNHYGPTESSVVTSADLVSAHGTGLPPIGRPIDNLATYVLDDALEPVLPGVPGELFIGGRGLARG